MCPNGNQHSGNTGVTESFDDCTSLHSIEDASGQTTASSTNAQARAEERESSNQPISPEMLAKLTEHANVLAWQRPNFDVLRPEHNDAYNPIVRSINHHLRLSDWRRRLVLPNLSAYGNETVAIFSDYGGETKGAKFATYSTLICGWNLAHDFLQATKLARERHALGNKEIALKDFGMGQLRRALPDYLTALDFLPGFLFTLAVDKRLTSMFAADTPAGRQLIVDALEKTDLGKRKAKVNEKLLRVTHIAAFLAGLLTHDGQRIFWMSDNDAISATPEMHQKTVALFQRILGLYARPGFNYPLIGGALPFAERSVDMLDMLSATDIVAGSLDKVLSRQDPNAELDQAAMDHGFGLVLQWLAKDGIGLKKMNVIMRPSAQGNTIETAALEFNLKNPPNELHLIPLKF